MASTLTKEHSVSIPEFLSGGGEMGQLIRDYDWSKTSLGPVESWPQSLRTCIRIMLTSRQPIWIGWGKDLIKFYNDPYKAIVGGKHPWALGKPASVVWKDIWKDIEPMLKQVMEKDEGTYVESQLLIMERNGYPEETYYTFSYTPIPGDDGKTAGMFCANTDDTERITSERQLKTLTQLGKHLADSRSNAEIIQKTIATLEENPYDFPFAIFRTIVNNRAVYTHSTALGDSFKLITKEIDLDGDNEISATVRKAFNEKKLQAFEHLMAKVGELPKGAWQVSPDKVIVLPIVQTATKEPYGLLVIGVNPYRLLDEKYLGFFSLVADQIATAFADVHVLEEERKRAEALAEIDRAKTTFFSNISHEFRTPLTLLLGPIEDVLNDPSTIQENKVRMDVAYRNALRMQKLVNTLLDFSRIEAGRMEGKFSPVNICSFTQELASTFRSAIEKAGMQLIFDCDNIQNEVYVDVDMWEKIVLNLVSNAFKYSRQGTITISIKETKNTIQFSVADKGVGIPPDQIDNIFDRFHRVENIQGRSQEGTGIGLSMVKELVRLHQGTISVESKLGSGSTFTVTIPSGKEHLSKDKIVEASASVSNYSDAFVLEADKWNTSEKNNEIVDNILPEEILEIKQTKKYKVLLADDNGDMREYVKRLLSDHFRVITAIDGEDAFNKIIKASPDLVLTDVMMPKLDGFGLLAKIRNHPDYKNLPVIMLSARAGEEAKVEGLDAGADDYLVKPFSAKELLARVEANIKIARNRIAAETNLRQMIRQSPVATVLLKGRSMVVEIVNEKALEIWGRTYEEVINRPVAEALPEIIEQGFDNLLQQVYDTGIPFNGNEIPAQLMRFGKLEVVYLNFIYQPLKNEHNETVGIIGVGVDVTEQVTARKKIEQNERELNELANSVPQLVWVADSDGEVLYYNNRVDEFAGAKKEKDGNWIWEGLVHPEDLKATENAWTQAVKDGTIYQAEHRIQLKTGEYRWFLSRAFPHKDDSGKILKWFGTATDIHAGKMQATILEEEVKKRTKELNESNISLMKSNNELQQFAHVASHDLKEPLRKVKTFASMLTGDAETSFSDKGKLYLGKINAAADRMGIMIDGVLNYSMMSSVHQKNEQVHLNQIFKNIESDLEILIAQKSAKLSYHHLPIIEGASVLLYQLFYNLINNSLKFSKSGQPAIIEISSSILQLDQKEFAAITITDNGIGFEQEFAGKIFETFSRLNSKDQFEGTGLGLSLCKRIVERHSGFIEAFGEPGKCARFVTYLPLKQEGGNI